MLILASHKVIFIHLHKCAGTSVEVALAPLLHWNDLLLGSTEGGEAIAPTYRRICGLYKHSSAAEVRAVVGAELWDTSFTFATVRAPHERIASLFTYLAALVERRLRHVGLAGPEDRERARLWMRKQAEGKDIFWKWAGSRAYAAVRDTPRPFSAFLQQEVLFDPKIGISFQPQVRRLCDADGRLLVRECVRMEELPASWPALCLRAGLPAVQLPRVNETPAALRRGFRGLDPDATDCALVARLFGEDYTRFGYDAPIMG